MKKITLDEAYALLKDGDKVCMADGSTEPQAFLSSLHKAIPGVKNLNIWMCLTMRSYPFLENPEYGNKVNINSLFFSKPVRAAFEKLNTVSYVPTHLRKTAVSILAQGAPDVFVGTCTPPDKNGKVSLGLSNVYESEVIKHAKIVIMEINPNIPYTYGEVEIDANDIDYCIDVDYPMVKDNVAPLNDKDKTIGAFISDYIKDGDCLQVGIGSIPNSVIQFMETKEDLGIHTELLGDGVCGLAKKGIVNGKFKTQHKGKIITSIVLGSQYAYDFVDHNPDVMVMSCAYVNAYETLAKNDNQISINTTVEVDLTGQCCSESVGSSQISGTGGQMDTAIGSQMAKGGKSFIALYSTANVRTGKGDERAEISKIVPQLKPGAAVSLSRNDLHHLVTEFGVVNLRGVAVNERVKRIISVAHPKFRDYLTEEAKKLRLI